VLGVERVELLVEPFVRALLQGSPHR
jgi:hypothetical protein